MEYVTHSLDEMKGVAQDVLEKIQPLDTAFVCALQGELGSGKTSFTQCIAGLCGVSEHVTSPTYVIQKTYPLSECSFNTLVHVDAYRLESERELEVLGFSKLLEDPSVLVCIEWADNVRALIPQNALWIHFKHQGGDARHVTVSAHE